MKFFISSLTILALTSGLTLADEVSSTSGPSAPSSYANIYSSDESQQLGGLDLEPPSGPVVPYTNFQNVAKTPEEEYYKANDVEDSASKEGNDMDTAETVIIGPPTGRSFGFPAVWVRPSYPGSSWGGHGGHGHNQWGHHHHHRRPWYRPSRCYWQYGIRRCY